MGKTKQHSVLQLTKVARVYAEILVCCCHFRYPIYYEDSEGSHRKLIKAYGIRFQVIVSGKVQQSIKLQ